SPGVKVIRSRVQIGQRQVGPILPERNSVVRPVHDHIARSRIERWPRATVWRQVVIIEVGPRRSCERILIGILVGGDEAAFEITAFSPTRPGYTSRVVPFLAVILPVAAIYLKRVL